jgi:hypothetical protein
MGMSGARTKLEGKGYRAVWKPSKPGGVPYMLVMERPTRFTYGDASEFAERIRQKGKVGDVKIIKSGTVFSNTGKPVWLVMVKTETRW